MWAVSCCVRRHRKQNPKAECSRHLPRHGIAPPKKPKTKPRWVRIPSIIFYGKLLTHNSISPHPTDVF